MANIKNKGGRPTSRKEAEYLRIFCSQLTPKKYEEVCRMLHLIATTSDDERNRLNAIKEILKYSIPPPPPELSEVVDVIDIGKTINVKLAVPDIAAPIEAEIIDDE